MDLEHDKSALEVMNFNFRDIRENVEQQAICKSLELKLMYISARP